jgi:hypothetical protein
MLCASRDGHKLPSTTIGASPSFDYFSLSFSLSYSLSQYFYNYISIDIFIHVSLCKVLGFWVSLACFCCP